jgi:hypothetical protein
MSGGHNFTPVTDPPPTAREYEIDILLLNSSPLLFIEVQNVDWSSNAAR